MNKICTVCPRSCKITVEKGIIFGNGCIKGEEFILTLNNSREYTGTIRLSGQNRIRIPFKTDGEIELELFQILGQEVDKLEVVKPIYIGDVIYENILGTGVNLVATKTVL